METTCYLVNQWPTSSLVDINPQEVWNSKSTSIKHLICFVYDAYVHVPREKRRKLDNKDDKCIFIGYKYGMKGCKLWNPITKKTIYSWYVVFREVKDVPRQEVTPMEKEPEKMEFELEMKNPTQYKNMNNKKKNQKVKRKILQIL